MGAARGPHHCRWAGRGQRGAAAGAVSHGQPDEGAPDGGDGPKRVLRLVAGEFRTRHADAAKDCEPRES